MSQTGMVIVNATAVSPVGLSLAESAASARARIARFREIEWRDRRFEPFIVASVPDEGLPDLVPELSKHYLQYRESRLLRLAHVALQEVLQPLAAHAIKVPLLLGMPEHHTTKPLDGNQFIRHLQQQTQAVLDVPLSMAAANGRAVGLIGLRRAAGLLEAQQAEFVLIGGVDSYLDLYVLGTLDMQQRLRTEVNSDGFTPGEGAAFLLVTRAETAQKYQLPVMAQIDGYAQGHEPGHLYADAPYLGEGLASTFSGLFAQVSDSQLVVNVYASFNGERYWGKEFGVARLRNGRYFAENQTMEHPAECFGDLGAAHGPMLAALAVHALHKRYRSGPSLVYAASDYGERAAVLFS